jgi:hypothetical protein
VSKATPCFYGGVRFQYDIDHLLNIISDFFSARLFGVGKQELHDFAIIPFALFLIAKSRMALLLDVGIKQ